MSQETFYIPWEDIVFGKGEIRIRSGLNTRNKILKTYKNSFTERNIKESLNQIKKFFQSDNPPKFYVVNNAIQPNSPFFEKLNELIDFAKLTGVYKLDDYPTIAKIKTESPFSSFNRLSLEEQRSLLLKSVKSEYLRQLIPIHLKEKRIIFLEERNGSLREDCFIFTTKNKKGKEILIWESAVESRATHLFFGGAESERNLKRYIMSEGSNKRQRLWNHDSGAKMLKNELNYIGFVKHDFPNSFWIELKRLIDLTYDHLER